MPQPTNCLILDRSLSPSEPVSYLENTDNNGYRAVVGSNRSSHNENSSSVQFSSVQPLSRVWLFATPWTAACQASLSITKPWSLLKLMSIELVMQSNHLILCCPLLLMPFPSIRVFSNESVIHIRWPKYWSFSFSFSPSNEYSGLISFRMDWFNLQAVQGTLTSLLQQHSSKPALIYWKFTRSGTALSSSGGLFYLILSQHWLSISTIIMIVYYYYYYNTIIIIITTVYYYYYCYPQLIDEQTKVQRGLNNLLRVAQITAEAKFNFRQFGSEAHNLSHWATGIYFLSSKISGWLLALNGAQWKRSSYYS